MLFFGVSDVELTWMAEHLGGWPFAAYLVFLILTRLLSECSRDSRRSNRKRVRRVAKRKPPVTTSGDS